MNATEKDAAAGEVHVLRLTYGVSRGHETYGDNIVTLNDETTGKRTRCMGSGYDMVGTVFADWMQDTCQDKLTAIRAQAYYQPSTNGYDGCPDGLYGMRLHRDGTVTLDGGCGIESMRRIADAIGVDVTRTHDHKGNTTGWVVIR